MTVRTRDRRQFLKSSALAASALAMSPGLFADEKSAAKQVTMDKLRIAVIGCGGRGGSNLQSVSTENIVALCDAWDLGDPKTSPMSDPVPEAPGSGAA